MQFRILWNVGLLFLKMQLRWCCRELLNRIWRLTVVNGRVWWIGGICMSVRGCYILQWMTIVIIFQFVFFDQVCNFPFNFNLQGQCKSSDCFLHDLEKCTKCVIFNFTGLTFLVLKIFLQNLSYRRLNLALPVSFQGVVTPYLALVLSHMPLHRHLPHTH